MTKDELYEFVHEMIPSDSATGTHELTERLVTRAMMLVVSGSDYQGEMIAALLSAALLNHRMAIRHLEPYDLDGRHPPLKCTCGLAAIYEGTEVEFMGVIHLLHGPCYHKLGDGHTHLLPCQCGGMLLTSSDDFQDDNGTRHTMNGCGMVPTEEHHNDPREIRRCYCGAYKVTEDLPFYRDGTRHSIGSCAPHSGTLTMVDQSAKSCQCGLFNDLSMFTYKDQGIMRHAVDRCVNIEIWRNG